MDNPQAFPSNKKVFHPDNSREWTDVKGRLLAEQDKPLVCVGYEEVDGMTLRDYFASACLQGFTARGNELSMIADAS